jgi:hypothetical protein
MDKAVEALQSTLATFAVDLDENKLVGDTGHKLKKLLHKCILTIRCEASQSTIGCYDILPAEILSMICEYLTARQVVALASTCREMQQRCTTDDIWQHFTRKIAKQYIERPEHKNHYWYYLAHRKYEPPEHGLVLISPCTYDKYTGDFVNGYRNGWGSLKDKYIGEWYMGLYHGEGTCYWDRYKGRFAYGYYHGTGTKRRGDKFWRGEWYYGEFLRGEWSDGKYTYEGEIAPMPIIRGVKRTSEDGEVMLATYYEGRVHEVEIQTSEANKEMIAAFGKLVFAVEARVLNDLYRGSIRDGKKHGLCEYIYGSGERRVGRYNDGAKDGWFMEFDAEGKRTIILWDKGEFVTVWED